MFDPKIIEDHATLQTVSLKSLRSDIFATRSSMDLVVKQKKPRTARAITGSPVKGQKDLLENHKRKPFWQIAPDNETIERLYEPEQEPIAE